MLHPPAHILASSEDALFSDPVSLQIDGLSPCEMVTLSLSHPDEDGVVWRSWATYYSDRQGHLDLATAASKGGTYIGVDADGLWWSMRPDGVLDLMAFQKESSNHEHQAGLPAGGPKFVRNYDLTVASEGRASAHKTLIRRMIDPAVSIEPLDDKVLKGVAYVHREPPRSKGAIMVVTGSDGGAESTFAPLLASAGYDVLALAYFNWPGLPKTIDRIDLGYFQTGFHWMRERFKWPTVAVQGRSRGGELALLLGATFPDDVAGVAAIAANSHVFAGWNDQEYFTGPAWTLNNLPLPFLPLVPSETPETAFGRVGAPWYDNALKPNDPNFAAIQVERINGPVLLVSGEEDQVWSAQIGAERVVARLKEKDFAHKVTNLRLPHVGHSIPPPQSVTTGCRSLWHSIVEIFLDCGGEPQATSAASRTQWQHLLKHYESVFDPTKAKGIYGTVT